MDPSALFGGGGGGGYSSSVQDTGANTSSGTFRNYFNTGGVHIDSPSSNGILYIALGVVAFLLVKKV